MERLVPASKNAAFLCNKKQLTLEEEVFTVTARNKSATSGTVITWRNLKGGTRACQWFGFQSDSYKGKFFKFKGWIKFVGSVPPQSSNFGLKVCGQFYNSFISKCAPDTWYHISELVHCKGGDGNHIILIFDSVSTKGQVVKLYDVTLMEIGENLCKLKLTQLCQIRT